MNRNRFISTIFTAGLLATGRVDAMVGDPKWRVRQAQDQRSFVIMVDATGLAKNERVTKVSCSIQYRGQNNADPKANLFRPLTIR